MRTLKRNTLPLLLVIIAALAGAMPGKADAQVVVYYMEFEKSGSSINFSFFDEALFVADGLGGTGSFVFAFKQDGRDFYTAAEDSGELFFATKPGKNRAVIRATADNNTALSHYLAMGDLDSKLTVNQRGQFITFNVATGLDGHVLASDTEADEEFSASDGSIGFAGMATMKVRLDRKRTDAANGANQTVAETTQAIIDELESRGFADSSTIDNPDAGTDDGTAPPDPPVPGDDATAVQTGEVSGSGG